MMFYTTLLTYSMQNAHSVLDFDVKVLPLNEKDAYLIWNNYNYSLTGFEMRLRRHSFKYVVNYYLPSGLFVVVSWVSERSFNAKFVWLDLHWSIFITSIYCHLPLFFKIKVSFQIHPDCVPGRMSLLVLLFLVLINIFMNVSDISPNVEGLSAISAWMICCILFVFGALIEYTMVLVKIKKCQNKKIIDERTRKVKTL